MKRTTLLLALVLAGCYAVPGAPLPPAPPPPVTPLPPPVEPFPPPEPPPVPPADVAVFLDRIVVGMTVTEAEAAVGARGNLVEASGPAPATLRWNLPGFMVFAVIEAGRVTRKGSTTVETPP